MVGINYEVEYNNRARVPEHPEIMARWQLDDAAFRSNHKNAELGLSYGRSERQKIDIFWPGAHRTARIALFIHGGYWRTLEPSTFSHFAAGANARGLALALPGYDLCPKVTMDEIIGQLRAAAAFLGRRHGGRLLACGHSAGGHLAACLVATDWKKLSADLPANLVPMGISISGLFDLEPLIHTSMNADLRLDVASARRASPIHWPLPPSADAFDAWVGGEESAEFLRQSRAIAEAWEKRGVSTRYQEVAGANHFTVVDPLANPASPLCERMAELFGL